MQATYDAIMALDRSAQDAENGGWVCGTVGEYKGGPSCANGLITTHLGHWRPVYLSDCMLTGEQRAAALIAGKALLRSIPDYMQTEMESLGATHRHVIANPESAHPVQIEDAVAVLNDLKDRAGWDIDDGYPPLLNGQRAAAWFRAAIDHLTKDLPIPTNLLTVDAILSAERGVREQVLIS